ncbi:MAG: NAD-dependent protein deacylase [Muribaculaceae bacterium]|nr:NAD-dependent protein deacylase [Muribaculaceae bacterium]
MKHIVFLTGAGISAESGLSTFRGKDGLWTKSEFEYYASLDCLRNEPQRCLDFYNMRRENLSKVNPNRAHKLVAELEKYFKVSVITQNVDNLHEKAGSTNILHLHGELTKVCASEDRYNEAYVKEYPLTTPLNVGDQAGDGSQLRPNIVMFGENVVNITKAADIVRRADVFVVIGTSLVVYPAALLLDYVPRNAEKFVIDPSDMPVCKELGYAHIQFPATEGMGYLFDFLDEWDCLHEDESSNDTNLFVPCDAAAGLYDGWQMKDAIMTVVEANHYSVWDIRQTPDGFRLELNETLSEDTASLLCGQFPLSADYNGEGSHGTIFALYNS